MAATLADALRRYGPAYLAQQPLTASQAKAWRSIVACRTKALGGQLLECGRCAHRHWQFHSCRNRQCPQCGARAKDRWLQGRLVEVLPVRYSHLVFTLPHQLNGLYGRNTRWVIDTLFECTSHTLQEFAANDKWMSSANGTPAFTLALHTWTQDLQRHIHLHVVMACGVLTKEGQWAGPRRKADFLFPVQALSRVFRGKFMALLSKAHQCGLLSRDPQGDDASWPLRQRQLYKHDWVVYAKTPLCGPAQVLEYLSRYSHRTAISNERIRSVDQNSVTFAVRADQRGGRQWRTLNGVEFVRRFLLHVLPSGIKRIRHYGILAAGCKKEKLEAARQSLQMPTVNPRAQESAQAFMMRVARIDVLRCPRCKMGVLKVVAWVPSPAHLPALCNKEFPRSRGPP
jgi:hypothetical protein